MPTATTTSRSRSATSAKDFAGLPVTVTAQATVTDLNRQAIAGTADLLVHPADYYVGLASNDTFVDAGQRPCGAGHRHRHRRRGRTPAGPSRCSAAKVTTS